MGVDDWSTNEAQNASLGNYDVSRGECPDASTSEHARELMANIKALSDSVDERFENFVGENIEVDGVTIVNNDGTLTVVDVAIGGDTEDLLTDKIAEIEAAAETASGKASDAATAAEQAAASATAAVGSVSSAVDAANLAAEQADIASKAAARAQSGAALAESAVQAVVAQTDLNWQKSSTAGAVAIYPVPETVLEPTVNFAFTETGPAEGTKAPDNPSTITGVSSVEVTRCGKNLLPYPYNSTSYSGNGITITTASDGTVTINGTCSATTFFSVCDCGTANAAVSSKVRLFSDLTYKMSLNIVSGSSTGSSIYLQCAKANAGGNATVVAAGYSATVDSASEYFDDYMKYRLRIGSGTACTNLVLAPQLELSSTATTFEPYSGADYTINLNGTYYGGNVDLATGVMTVTHVFLEIDPDVISISCNTSYEGTDTSACYFIPSQRRASPRACAWSNRFLTDATIGSFSYDVEMIYSGTGAESILLRINKTRLGNDYDATSVTAIKSAWETWLRANPTYVVYQLATPTTIQLTPQQILSLTQTDKYTPRCNTVYSDQTSVQVGYAKSPIQSELDLTNAIVALGGNI